MIRSIEGQDVVMMLFRGGRERLRGELAEEGICTPAPPAFFVLSGSLHSVPHGTEATNPPNIPCFLVSQRL